MVKDQSEQIERQSQHIERQSQHIERQSGQIERQSHQIERQDKEQLERIEILMSRIEDQSQQIKRLMSNNKEQSEKIDRSISTVQGQPPQREARVTINRNFPTPFEWKIPNIKQARISSQNLVSKPFYLFEPGYRYLLQIKTLSTGCPIDLGVYIKVVPGEYDELLSWPCKEKVRVTRVNQDAMFLGESKSNVIDFEKDGEPCSRPLNNGHHKYRLVLKFGSYFVMDAILIRVNKE